MSENSFVLDRPFERPLLAIDWSPASLRAVDYLRDLVKIIREINVVYVASEKELTGSSAMDIQKTRKAKRRKLDKICDIFESEGISARSHVYIGDPKQELETAARDCQASVIVAGSSGKSGWVERWLGSTPLHIAEKSAYPTLLIPPQKKK
jgi:nucleotide-binding universal stress UspA family protein